MAGRTSEDTGAELQAGLPRPRFGWLAIFQLLIIAVVVLTARETRAFSEPPMLEDQLESLMGSSGALPRHPWGGRGWLAAVVAMVGALLLMLPVAWAYVATRMQKRIDASVVTTIVLLPIAVAAILVIVQDSLAVAFSLAGIAGLVRFRNALDDTRDAMYVVIAIAVGLGAGVGTLEASAALTGVYNLAVVALWIWHTSRPIIADIALGEHTVPKGQTVLEALTRERGHHPKPLAEWFEPEQSVPLDGTEPPKQPEADKRDGMLRVHASDDIPTRRLIEEVLDGHTKRWTVETDEPGPDNLPSITYRVRLKKRIPSDALLQALRERLTPGLGEYLPSRPMGNGTTGRG